MKSIKKYQVPEWFDLDKYAAFENLTSKEWANQLYKRSFLVKDPSEKTKLLKSIKSNPIVPGEEMIIGTADSDIVTRSTKRHNTFNESDLVQQSVAPLTCENAYYFAKELADIKNEINGGNQKFCTLPIDSYYQKKGIGSDGLLNLTINVNAPDYVLTQNFKMYLEAARTHYNYLQGVKISENIITRLYQSRIIQYMDLSLWLELEDLSVPNHVLGDWLFPYEDVDIAEKIRKVTKPFAAQATSYDFIVSIASMKV